MGQFDMVEVLSVEKNGKTKLFGKEFTMETMEAIEQEVDEIYQKQHKDKRTVKEMKQWVKDDDITICRFCEKWYSLAKVNAEEQSPHWANDFCQTRCYVDSSEDNILSEKDQIKRRYERSVKECIRQDVMFHKMREEAQTPTEKEKELQARIKELELKLTEGQNEAIIKGFEDEMIMKGASLLKVFFTNGDNQAYWVNEMCIDWDQGVITGQYYGEKRSFCLQLTNVNYHTYQQGEEQGVDLHTPFPIDKRFQCFIDSGKIDTTLPNMLVVNDLSPEELKVMKFLAAILSDNSCEFEIEDTAVKLGLKESSFINILYGFRLNRHIIIDLVVEARASGGVWANVEVNPRGVDYSACDIEEEEEEVPAGQEVVEVSEGQCILYEYLKKKEHLGNKYTYKFVAEDLKWSKMSVKLKLDQLEHKNVLTYKNWKGKLGERFECKFNDQVLIVRGEEE
jgi:hypothetical protein